MAAEIHLLLLALNSNQLLFQLSITFACEFAECIHIMVVNIYNAAVAILNTTSMTLWWAGIERLATG